MLYLGEGIYIYFLLVDVLKLFDFYLNVVIEISSANGEILEQEKECKVIYAKNIFTNVKS